MRRAATILALAVSAAGCVTTKAQTSVERPALEVPPVPARIIERAPLPEVARIEPEPELVPELPDPAPTARGAAAGRPRDTAANAKETHKPEAKPEAPPTDVAAAPPPQAAAGVSLLRTQATADAAAAERQIVETLTRARKNLEVVNYQRLTEPRQKAYNEAKDFISGAEREVKASNFELAKELADKAEKYATALLQGR